MLNISVIWEHMTCISIRFVNMSCISVLVDENVDFSKMLKREIYFSVNS